MSRKPTIRRNHRRYKESALRDFPDPQRMAENIFVGYPSSYRTGMSNLGFHFLYGNLRSRRAMKVERFFTDTSPHTYETGQHLSKARALFFSVSYEEDYLNLARILVESGVEPLRERRRSGPLLIAGGPAPSANPVPLGEIVDVVAIGEGESVIDSLADLALSHDIKGGGETARYLEGFRGIYVPGSGEVKSSFAEPEVSGIFTASAVISDGAAFPNMALIEVGRGCPGRCRFCLASALYRPLRMVSFADFKGVLEDFTADIAKVGLVSTSVSAHPDFREMIDYLTGRGVVPSFSSLRAEDIDEERAGALASAGVRSVALAPESGSEKMRAGLGKRVADETYINAAALLRDRGIRKFNLYILTGYPGESEDTYSDTAEFLGRFAEAASGSAVSVHINPLVPKAWTPFQFHAMERRKKLESKLGRLESVCRKAGLNPSTKSIRGSFRQAVLSLGDREVGRAVAKYAGGRISWIRALKDSGVDPDFIHSPRGIDKALPWDGMEGPVKKSELIKRYKNTGRA